MKIERALKLDFFILALLMITILTSSCAQHVEGIPIDISDYEAMFISVEDNMWNGGYYSNGSWNSDYK
ncbi:MAG: hypothetical protein SWO11_21375 [Thermodesulfobacteriota bacterium]|nr:hypothetical protein [Thermodesulfobacteriota bacterium]